MDDLKLDLLYNKHIFYFLALRPTSGDDEENKEPAPAPAAKSSSAKDSGKTISHRRHKN